MHAGAQDIDTLTVVEADTAEIHKPGVLRLLDNVLDFRDNLMKCDTMYISSLPQKIKLGFAVNCSGAEIDAKGVGEHGDFRTMLSAEMKTTVSVNVAYRGLGIGLKLNPANMFGKNPRRNSIYPSMATVWA